MKPSHSQHRASGVLRALVLVAASIASGCGSGAAAQWHAPSGETVVFDAEQVELARPIGFTTSDVVRGLWCEESGVTIAAALLPAAFSKVDASLSNATLAANGLEVLERTNLDVGGLPGLYVEANQRMGPFEIHKLILCFGDDDSTHQIAATIPIEFASVSREDLRNALLASRRSTIRP